MTKSWKSRLMHSGATVPGGFKALSVPVERASTVLFPDSASVAAGWDVEAKGHTYGIHGTPTALALAGRIAELEGGERTLLAPSGLSAIALVDLALLRGARGTRPADLDALASVITRIADAALSLGPSLRSLEVNPLWVNGEQIEALDVLVVTGTADSSQDTIRTHRERKREP